jgi:hypothetical protein
MKDSHVHFQHLTLNEIGIFRIYSYARVDLVDQPLNARYAMPLQQFAMHKNSRTPPMLTS